MEHLEPFIKTFGGITLETVVIAALACIFIWRVYVKVKESIIEQHEREEAKDHKLDEALNQIKQYPKWREQSITIQKELTTAINGLKEEQTKLSTKLDTIEKQNKTRRRNEIRERLLHSYRYYTSKDKNPLQAWSEMEAEAFWETYADYDELGGNSHVHNVVRPAMRELEVIKMDDAEQLETLMKSRR